MKQTKLPESFRGYFWDVDFNSLTLEEAPLFVLKRIIDRGDANSVNWALKHFSREDIKNIIVKTRDLSRKTAIFWANILGVNYNNLACLKTPYSRIPFGLSS